MTWIFRGNKPVYTEQAYDDMPVTRKECKGLWARLRAVEAATTPAAIEQRIVDSWAKAGRVIAKQREADHRTIDGQVLDQVRAALDTPTGESVVAHAERLTTQLRRLADGNDWDLEWDKPGDLEALVDDVLDQLDRLGHCDD